MHKSSGVFAFQVPICYTLAAGSCTSFHGENSIFHQFRHVFIDFFRNFNNDCLFHIFPRIETGRFRPWRFAVTQASCLFQSYHSLISSVSHFNEEMTFLHRSSFEKLP